MNILSLFGGIECGKVAAERAGISFNKYYTSEIDKFAIEITTKNHPDAIQLGDVNEWRPWEIDWSSIGLVMGGSPCQGFSVAGKQLNFDDERSKLFFVFVDILEHVKQHNPNVKFLLENVKMKKEFENIISQFVGVEPVEINSALVSAQNRKRLYWTNISAVEQPEDKGILLKDIVHEFADVDREKALCLTSTYYKGARPKDYFEKSKRQLVFEKLSEFVLPYEKAVQLLENEVKRGKIACSNGVYYIHNKEVSLDVELYGILNLQRGNNEGGLRNNGEKAPTMTSNKWQYNNHLLFGCIDPNSLNKKQNGQRFSNGQKFYTLTRRDHHGILIEGYLRMLTPIECERLQTLPDDYTAGVSKTQRYKMLGNAWTVDVITHILSKFSDTQQN